MHAHRGIRCRFPFFNIVSVCKHTGFFFFCLFTPHISIIALPLTCPSKPEHKKGGRTPNERGFPLQRQPLLCGMALVIPGFLCFCSSMYDQLPYSDCHGGSPSKRQNLHLEEADTLLKLDRSAYKR